MNQEEVLDFIEHHGVKGMHWGVRNEKKPKPTSSDHKKTAHLRGRPTHELSNKQIKALNERLNLEQNHRRLNPSKIEKGHTAAKAFLAIAGTAIAVNKLFSTQEAKALVDVGKHFVTTAKIVKLVK